VVAVSVVRVRRHRRPVVSESAAKLATYLRGFFPGMPERDVISCALRATARGGSHESIEPTPNSAHGLAISFIRHRYTKYDAMLARGVDREESRRRVRPQILDRLTLWKSAYGMTDFNRLRGELVNSIAARFPRFTQK
jgi:hypothetical protein